jgi:hypothetical protein
MGFSDCTLQIKLVFHVLTGGDFVFKPVLMLDANQARVLFKTPCSFGYFILHITDSSGKLVLLSLMAELSKHPSFMHGREFTLPQAIINSILNSPLFTLLSPVLGHLKSLSTSD